MDNEQLQQEIENLKRELDVFKRHDHLISGGEPLRLKDLPYYGLQSVSVNIPQAQTDTNYDAFFTAEYDLEIVSASESHGTASSISGVLNIEKLPDGSGPDTGTDIFTTNFDLTASIYTTQRKTPTAVVANRTLKRGDRLGLRDAGNLTSCRNVTVTVWFLPLYKISK